MVTRTKDHGISLVSPRWVVESCQRGKRLSWSAVYLPECRQTTAPNADSDAVIKLDKESRKRRRSQKGEVSDSSSVGVFRGCVFVLLRVAPPVERVDFAVSDVEAMITGPPGGGQILTRDVLDDMQSRNTKKASAASSEQPNKQQTCYVVCWGGECGTGSSSFGGADDDDGSGTTSWPKLEDRHPLLWQLKQQRLCHIVHTTPIWVQTCLTEQKRIAPKRYPELFQPTNYPLHLLSHKQTLHSNHHDSETSKMLDVTCPTTDMRISLTGFVGWQRSALIHFLQAMGATYDDALHPNTTHLLVADTVVQQNDNETLQQQRGAKYEKAVEWKISIVTLEWLYQGARCGFPNDSKTVDDNSDT
jgi:twin BRCT domain